MSEVSVRYIASDVDEAMLFYTKMLGFQVGMLAAPRFASLVLNRPGADGRGQAMSDVQTPGGWNHIQIQVETWSEMLSLLCLYFDIVYDPWL